MTLTVTDVGYAYRRRTSVLQDITLTINDGLVALLGENGAGKSTLMRLLATDLPMRRGGGSYAIAGIPATHGNLPALRRMLGWVPQDCPFDPAQRVGDTVATVAWLRGMPRSAIPAAVSSALDRVSLADRATTRIRALSGGLRRRMDIATGLVHSPRVLLLDEPTAGLDPNNRSRVLRILRDIADDGVVVLLSTHLAADAEACDRVLFLSHRHIVDDRPTTEFLDRYGGIDAAFAELTGHADDQ